VKNKNIFVALVDRAPSNNDNSVRDLYVAGNNPALGATAGGILVAPRGSTTSGARTLVRTGRIRHRVSAAVDEGGP
jgi:hypothetical protein